jgi:hypothetical protein
MENNKSNQQYYYKQKRLNKEQQQLGDFSLPHSLYDYENAKIVHECLVDFLKENDAELFINPDTQDKLFSREYKYARQQYAFKDALFFIHHNNDRLNKWFSYNIKESNFKKLYKSLKIKGFYVDVFEDGNVSGIFKGFGKSRI